MTKTINVESLSNYKAAHFLNDNEDIRTYIRIVEEEGDISAFSETLNTIFLAMGANAVAKALGMNVQQVWDAQERPSDHLDSLQKIIGLLKEVLSDSSKRNPHLGGNFEDFLKDEGIYDEVTASAMRQIEILKQSRNKE